MCFFLSHWMALPWIADLTNPWAGLVRWRPSGVFMLLPSVYVQLCLTRFMLHAGEKWWRLGTKACRAAWPMGRATQDLALEQSSRIRGRVEVGRLGCLASRPRHLVGRLGSNPLVDGRYCISYDHQLSMNMKENTSKCRITLATNIVSRVMLNI